jgi:hypothetical protein
MKMQGNPSRLRPLFWRLSSRQLPPTSGCTFTTASDYAISGAAGAGWSNCLRAPIAEQGRPPAPQGPGLFSRGGFRDREGPHPFPSRTRVLVGAASGRPREGKPSPTGPWYCAGDRVGESVVAGINSWGRVSCPPLSLPARRFYIARKGRDSPRCFHSVSACGLSLPNLRSVLLHRPPSPASQHL